MDYVDYIGNVCRLVVEVVNEGGSVTSLSDESRLLCEEHAIVVPAGGLGGIVAMLGAALAATADRGDIAAINRLLSTYPPQLVVTNHDGNDVPHIHFAEDGEDALRWLGRTCGAALAYVRCGHVSVRIGRCAAAECDRFFVDDSRNRSRRFCSSACASRTTVSAFRARQRATDT